jgi:hypothetical protein
VYERRGCVDDNNRRKNWKNDVVMIKKAKTVVKLDYDFDGKQTS